MTAPFDPVTTVTFVPAMIYEVPSDNFVRDPDILVTVIEPPVIVTLFEFCVEIVPRPRLDLAVVASEAPVPPSAIARSVIPVTEPPVIDTLEAACVEIVPSPKLVLAVDTDDKSDRLFDLKAYVVSAPVAETPRFVLAVAASDAPVPPSATARSVIPVIEPPVIETLEAD